MAVFRSKPKTEAAPAIHSLLGKDVVLTGEVHTGTHSLRVEGTVDGTIHSIGEVSIAPTGLVKGTIYAKHLVVTGRAEGTLKITECLEIHGTGWVEGDVEVGSLVVDEGGTLQGVCVRRDREQDQPAQKAPEINGTSPSTAKGGSLPTPHRLADLRKIDPKF